MGYSDKVIEHFRNPKNMGKMENPDGVGTVGNPVCGDMMKIYIKVEDGKIVDAKIETFGCVAAIATSSMTTEMAIGMTIEEAKELSRQEVAEALDGLPPQKMHCSNLAADALHKAIEDYESRQT
ncbi:MAG: Fe-S cluster assembly scaffold protein NifU [Candidatus Thorarchaeota archaeon]|nr:MAG: Fe-S cluster assembly scaffold protein NifU [Candidatus Thorarchaeota archaeon]